MRTAWLVLVGIACAWGCSGGTVPDAPDVGTSMSDAGVGEADTGVGSADGGTSDADTREAGADGGEGDASRPGLGVVRVVLFTHVEDASPPGDLSSAVTRTAYGRLRTALLRTALRMEAYGLRWVLQPDYKFLEAARLYEDAATTATTGGMNVLVYLRDVNGVVIDPHSHENGGYNYTDVAHLLGLLGVGGSTVIGGHVWDPALPEFQAWDRFRVEVGGAHYPDARWRGDILMGAGTPGHVNDPRASGVWRPRDRDHFFEDDPTGNIVSVSMWENEVAGVRELIALHESGAVPADQLLTAGWNITPMTLTSTDGLDTVERDVLMPLAALRDEGKVEVTDFTSLVETWRRDYGARSSLYLP